MNRSRSAFPIVLIGFFIVTILFILAQTTSVQSAPLLQPPFATPVGGGFPGGNQPPFAGTTVPGGNQPPFGASAQPPGGGQPLPQSTVQQASLETATPMPTLTPMPDQSALIVVAARNDLELLADASMNGARPDGWLGTRDPANPDLTIHTRLDLELLAGTLLGANVRPPGWFGVVPSTAYAVARDVRHDVELLARTFGAIPAGWTGANPLLSCDRSTQAIVQFLEINGVFQLAADPTSPDFCQQAVNQATVFMEINILTSSKAGTSLVVPGLAISGGNSAVNSNFAVAFLDRFANQRAGVVPNTMSIEAVAKSAGEFSNMMLIRGQGFQVYVDFQFTSVTADQFNSLPPADDATETFCTADWCG